MRLNISKSKCNQAVQFGQVMDYNLRNVFYKYYTKNEAGRLAPDLFLFFKKAFH